MVKIVKGSLVKTVPVSAFDNFFKTQGWELADGENTSPSVVPVNVPKVEKEEVVDVPAEDVNDDAEEEINDEEWDEALDELIDEEVEKPLSEMNKEELVAKAKKMGINTTNLTNKQLREAIKSSK